MEITDSSIGHAKLVHIGYFTGPSSHVFSRCRRRAHECQIIVVTGGIYIATVDTPHGLQQLRARPGDVVFWPPGSEDTDESEPGNPLVCINIFLRWPDPIPVLPFLVRDTEQLINRLTSRLLSLVHDPVVKPLSAEMANFYLAALLAEYVNLAKAVEDPILAQVAEYTERNIHRTIRLEELARLAGLDKHHFGRKYKALTGRTPIEDVQRRKAIYAKYILGETPDRTLENLATYVGIRHSATLSRLIARHTGVSVRDIRKTRKIASK